MKMVIYIALEKYMSQWLTHSLGSPVEFPRGSNENAIIRRFVQTPPAGSRPDIAAPGMVPIVIPESTGKDSTKYFYMGPMAKRALAESIEDLFRMNLWQEMSGLLQKPNNGVMPLIYAWCELHGIDTYYAETIRQKYYRMRRSYEKKGIYLKFFEKKGGVKSRK